MGDSHAGLRSGICETNPRLENCPEVQFALVGEVRVRIALADRPNPIWQGGGRADLTVHALVPASFDYTP